ncbi:MAG: hypothetical protein ACJAZ1_003422 [Yoonia sp.]
MSIEALSGMQDDRAEMEVIQQVLAESWEQQ